MKTKAISLFLSIFLVLETMPVFAVQNLAAQYAETAHAAYNKSDFLKAGQYYEKAYQSEKNKVFIDNAITAYLSYAFNLANKKDFEGAIKYCEKVLSIRPNDKNAKELLSDIYYTRASDYLYNRDKEQTRKDLENALKYSILPDQSQKAREALADLKNIDEKNSQSQIRPVSVSVPSTIPDTLKLMEMKIYGKAQEKFSVMDRIQKIEKDVFNKNYSEDSLINRLDRLKKVVLPELAQKPVNNYSANQDYIQDIIEQSNGTARIFGEMPIFVYMDDGNTKTYKKYYKDAVKVAMKEWETASNGKIKFEETNDPMKSNLKVTWIDYYEDFAWHPELKKEDVAAEKQKIKYGKANTIVQMSSLAAMALGALAGVPAIGMIGSVGGSVASPYLQYKSLDLDDKALQVKINTDCTSGLTKEQAMEKIKQIAMHQLGHAIGIYGHSPDSNDIMYANFSVNRISDRDKNTINQIYKNVKQEEKPKKKLLLH